MVEIQGPLLQATGIMFLSVYLYVPLSWMQYLWNDLYQKHTTFYLYFWFKIEEEK